MYTKLAWRNLWRNKRRTYITLASVFFAVILSTLMMSMKEGVYEQMINLMVRDYTGYAQVHANGYWEDKIVDNSFVVTDTLLKELGLAKELISYAPKIESYALAASEVITKGARVIGVDPQKEKEHVSLHERVIAGDYFQPDDQAVLLGVGLASYLKLDVGDTLVLLSQGYHGATASGKYFVKGIVKFGSPELSKQLVFLPIKEAQVLYDLKGMYTNIVLLPKELSDTETMVVSLQKRLGNTFEVMTWQQLNPDLVNMISTDRSEGYVFMFILYTVIAFGIFGTIIMMLAERKHEFGVMVAIGMKRMKLAWVVFLEVMTISVLGAILGMFAAFPICAYFYVNPIHLGEELSKMTEEYGMEAILQASIAPNIFFQQALTVALIAALIAIYPFLKLLRMNVINTMNS